MPILCELWMPEVTQGALLSASRKVTPASTPSTRRTGSGSFPVDEASEGYRHCCVVGAESSQA